MITITLDMIFQALTDITAGNEDFVYEPPKDPETGISQDNDTPWSVALAAATEVKEQEQTP